MKHLLLSTLAGTLLAASGLALAPGQPGARVDYRREFLPAATTLVAHVDVVAFNASTFGEMFASSRADLNIQELEDLEQDLGFDPFQVLRSITVYGVGSAPEPTTVIVMATKEIDDALYKLQEDEKFHLVVEEGIEIFEYEGTHGYVQKDGENRVIVLAESLEETASAARVVRGEEPNLRDVEGKSMQVAPVAGSFLFVAASEGVPGMEDFQPTSQVFGLAQGLQLDLGEAGGSIFAHLGISTGDADSARDVVDLVQALITITRLTGLGEVPEINELLYALRVSARGGTVSVDFEYPVEELAEVLEDAVGGAGGQHDDDMDHDEDHDGPSDY